MRLSAEGDLRSEHYEAACANIRLDNRYAVAVLTTNPTGSWTIARQSIDAVTKAVLVKLGVNS